EQRAVGVPAQRAIPSLGRCVDQALNLDGGQDVRSRSGTGSLAKHRWRNLMPPVLRANVPCETNDVVQPPTSRVDRLGYAGPSDGRLRTDERIALGHGKSSKAQDVASLLPE